MELDVNEQRFRARIAHKLGVDVLAVGPVELLTELMVTWDSDDYNRDNRIDIITAARKLTIDLQEAYSSLVGTK